MTSGGAGGTTSKPDPSLTRFQQLGALHAVDVGSQLRDGGVRPDQQHAVRTTCSDVIDLPRLAVETLAGDGGAIANVTVSTELTVAVPVVGFTAPATPRAGA